MFSRKKQQPAVDLASSATATAPPLPVEAAIEKLERLQAERLAAAQALEQARTEVDNAERRLIEARERAAADAGANGSSKGTAKLVELREAAEVAQVRVTSCTRRLEELEVAIGQAQHAARQTWTDWSRSERMGYETRLAAAAESFDEVVREGLARGIALGEWGVALRELMRISVVYGGRHIVGPDRHRYRKDAGAMAAFTHIQTLKDRLARAMGDDSTALPSAGEIDEEDDLAA